MTTPEPDEPVAVAAVLRAIKLGSPVAEHDTSLANYFIETDTFQRLLSDEGDTVAGDKGTGKSALYRILDEQHEQYQLLEGVRVVAAFNPAGTPVFQRLVDEAVLSESEYIRLWKTYVVGICGNWVLDSFPMSRRGKFDELETVLVRSGLRVSGGGAPSMFSRLIDGWSKPKSAEVGLSFTSEGIPLASARVEMSEAQQSKELVGFVRHDEALGLVNECLRLHGVELWLVLDRLDEAFQASPVVELPALRALFRCYLDLQGLEAVRMKIFVRHDLFSRVIAGGFVNLTHINARKISITWEDEDLLALLIRRLRDSSEFLDLLKLQDASDQEIFDAVFPEKVDQGERRPLTWNWILTRIRDGNDVKSPRNLVDLVATAIGAQLRREVRSSRSWQSGEPLLTGDALKQALVELSKNRVEDTLIAEAGDMASAIRKFENGKAEHNDESLRLLIGESYAATVKRLSGLGFLEQIGANFKVPPLYRAGLNIAQGKAF